MSKNLESFDRARHVQQGRIEDLTTVAHGAPITTADPGPDAAGQERVIRRAQAKPMSNVALVAEVSVYVNWLSRAPGTSIGVVDLSKHLSKLLSTTKPAKDDGFRNAIRTYVDWLNEAPAGTMVDSLQLAESLKSMMYEHEVPQ